jgi:hypothetical protein
VGYVHMYAHGVGLAWGNVGVRDECGMRRAGVGLVCEVLNWYDLWWVYGVGAGWAGWLGQLSG